VEFVTKNSNYENIVKTPFEEVTVLKLIFVYDFYRYCLLNIRQLQLKLTNMIRKFVYDFLHILKYKIFVIKMD
jgi:hypothetical protein